MAISSNTTGLRPGVCTSTSRPSSPYTGQTIFETDTNRMYVWNGSAWVIPNSPAQNPMGLELITTTTCTSGGTASGGIVTIGSSVSNVVMGNVFSSTYDNYRIVLSAMFPSAAGSSYYLRLSGSPSSTYYWAGNYQGYSAGTSVNIGSGNGSATGLWVGITGGYSGFSADIHSPFKANATNYFGSYSTNTWTGVTGGQDNNAVSHTGFTVYHETNTMSGGTIRIYGYRNS